VKLASHYSEYTIPQRRIIMTPKKAALFAVVLAVVFALTPQPVFAGQPVDPATLNPPPPPEFNPVCMAVGNGTHCTVQFSDPPFAGGSGVTCSTGANAYEVFQFQNRSVQGTRDYDSNGNLTRRHFHEVVTGTLSNPLTHTAVSFTGRGNTLHDLSVPGDILSGTQVLTGSFRVYRPHGGTVIFEAGRTVNTGDGTFIRESGPHPFQDYFVFGDTAAVQPLCDALQ
jgi:hypothetical protein